MGKAIHFFILFLTLLLGTAASTQNTYTQPERLKIFIDCSNTWCDMNYIRTEINIVDFLEDRLAADVHVLITSQNTGSGNNQYQMIFYGQNRFTYFTDTIQFTIAANATQVEAREALIKQLKIGLIPLISKTGLTAGLTIGMKQDGAYDKRSDSSKRKDTWNYWVFNISANGNLSADKIYKSNRYSGNFTVNRITEALKVNFSVFGSENKTTYTFTNDTASEKLVVTNSDYGIMHYLVKSINSHWSAGYEVIYNNNTFSNYKRQLYVRTAFEYNIFPYKEVNNKFFTISYGIVTRFNRYYDTTIYNKLRERLYGHLLEGTLSLNKKWGTLNAGISYSNFFHDWQLNNLSANIQVDVRITGSLSFFIYSFSALVHDQVYIPKSGATEQEVLTRLRQLETSYSFQSGFGINYRFGSKLNNFVNPRFKGSGGRSYFF